MTHRISLGPSIARQHRAFDRMMARYKKVHTMTHTDPRFLPIIPVAQASHHKFYPHGPFVSISLAQWAVESGYGAHMSGLNNPFGIKARPGQASRQVLTKEYLNGHWITELQPFANYDSLEEAFDAHAELLTSSHYQACRYAATPSAYAQALHTCGYATAPTYAQALMAVIHANNLEQYDQVF